MFVKGLLFGFILGSLSMAIAWYAYDYGRNLAFTAGNYTGVRETFYHDEQGS